jgi:hypothetical protein
MKIYTRCFEFTISTIFFGIVSDTIIVFDNFSTFFTNLVTVVVEKLKFRIGIVLDKTMEGTEHINYHKTVHVCSNHLACEVYYPLTINRIKHETLMENLENMEFVGVMTSISPLKICFLLIIEVEIGKRERITFECQDNVGFTFMVGEEQVVRFV